MLAIGKKLSATTWLILFVAVLCAARAIFFYLRYSQSPDLIIVADSMDYIGPANSLYESGTYANIYGPEFRRAPGYPAFIAVIYAIFGKGNLLAVVAVQQLLDFVTALLIAFFGRLIGGTVAAFVAAVLYLSDFVGFVFVNSIQNETLFVFLLCLCVALLCRALRDGEWRPGLLVGAGLLLTVATYVRPVSLYLFFPLAIGIGILILRRHASWRRGVSAAALFLVPWLILGSLWYARNVVTMNSFRFVAQENELLLERASIMVGEFEGVPHHAAAPYFEKYFGTNQPTKAGYLKFYAEHFGTYTKLTVLSLVDTFFAPSQWYFPFYFPSYPTERAASGDYLRKGDIAGLIRDLLNRGVGNLLLLGGVIGHLAGLNAGAVVGLFRLGRGRRAALELIVPAAIILCYFILLIGIWGGGARFRLPMSPFLAALSACGYAYLVQKFWRKGWDSNPRGA